jgi:hypothetical protein
MSVKAFRASLEPAPGPLLDRTLASTADPVKVFGRSVQAVAAMGAPLRRSRLAVAIAKTDLPAGHGLVPDRLDGSDVARAWLCEGLGLRSLVQAMELDFQEVRCFRTAAVADGDARVDGSITRFVDWCLRD